MWVADAKQAKAMALDLVALQQSAAYQAGEAVTIPEDVLLEEMVNEGGVAYLDRSQPAALVAKLTSYFADDKIKILLIPKDGMLYRLPQQMPTAPINVIVGSQEYRGGEGRWADYALSSLLGMIHSVPTRQGTVILCPPARRAVWAALLAGPLPLESSLDGTLADILNAEVAVRAVTSKQDAVDYLTWTYFYRRLARNPNFYGLAVVGQRALSEHLSELVEGALSELSEAKCIQVVESSEGSPEDEEPAHEELSPLNLGLIAAYYGVKCATAEMLALSLNATTKLRGILECIAAAVEFDVLPLRWGEVSLLERLHERLPLKIPDAAYTDAHVKASLLLQAHFTRLPLPPTLKQDQEMVVQKSLPLVQAAVDVLASYGFLAPALLAMEFSQMLVQAVWNTDPPLRQLFDGKELSLLTQKGLSSVYDLDTDVLGGLQLDGSMQKRVKIFCDSYPAVDVQFGVDNDEIAAGSDSILRATMVRQSPLSGTAIPAPHYPAPKEEAWWLLLGVPATRSLLGLKRFILPMTMHTDGTTSVQVNVPFTVPDVAGQCSAKMYLVSDCWVGADQEFDLSFHITSN